MRKVSAGYTIVEVTIFLAVSAGLLIAAMRIISGKQAQVDFDQKIRATQAQLQSWIGDVSNGFTGGDPSQQYCDVVGNRPIIKTKTGTPVSPKCVYLGKAIQFTDVNNPGGNPSKIYAYSVFGVGQQPDNYVDAQAAPAVGPNGLQVGGNDLTGVFDMGAVQVKSVASQALDPTGNPSAYTSSHLVGFFSSFNTDSSVKTNGSEDLNAYQFEFDGSNPTPGNASSDAGAALIDCLEQLTSSSCYPSSAQALTDKSNWPEKLQSLAICLSDGSRTALLTISSNSGIGAATKLEYKSC